MGDPMLSNKQLCRNRRSEGGRHYPRRPSRGFSLKSSGQVYVRPRRVSTLRGTSARGNQVVFSFYVGMQRLGDVSGSTESLTIPFTCSIAKAFRPVFLAFVPPFR